jgi:hypothetical protein
MTTREALRAHLEKWTADHPYYEIAEQHAEAIRWLCERLDYIMEVRDVQGGR